MTLMSQEEHFNCRDLEWDPTGRFVASYVSCFDTQVDTGYILWNFQGRKLQQHNVRRKNEEK